MHEADIEMIIAQYNEGNSSSFSKIYKLYYAWVCHFAYKLLDSVEDAEDVTIEVFINFFNRQQKFEGENNIKAYLFIAVRNACFNHLKFQKRIRENQTELSYLTREHYPDSELIEQAVLETLYNSIETLPAGCKRVFKMLYIKGLNTVEVARELGISVDTVKNQRKKALRILRAIIFEHEVAIILLLYSFRILYYI